MKNKKQVPYAEQDPYLGSDEGDDTKADASFKKDKGWDKLWSATKKEVGKDKPAKKNKKTKKGK